MKKLIQISILLLIAQFSFGQSVEITPNRTITTSTFGDNVQIFSRSTLIGFQTFRFNGTINAKTPVVADNDLLRLGGGGYYNNTDAHIERASIIFKATENWTSTAGGTKITFYTTPNGSISVPERMVINHNGYVGIGSTTPITKLDVVGANSTEIGSAGGIASFRSTESTSYLTFFRNTNTYTGYLGTFNDASNNSFEIGTGLGNTTGSLFLSTNATPRLTVTPGGDVRIGAASSNVGGAKMMINDNSTCCGSVRSTLALFESETGDGPRLKFANQNSTTNSLFWDIFGLPRASGQQANAVMNFYYSTGDGTGNNVLQLFGNGNSLHQGFTRLGFDAPAIKMKKLTGTTASSQGSMVSVAHGVTASKILSVRVMVEYFSSPVGLVPDGYNRDNDYECNVYVAGDYINVVNKAGNSANILNKPFTILVTYEE